jgi:hypothetical protein
MRQLNRFIAGLVASLLLFSLAPVGAQDQQSGSGLSISPTVSQYTIKPGASDKLTITLKNTASGDITAQALVNDFKSDNKTGNPQIITDTTQQTPQSIKDFVIGLKDVPLAKGEQKTLNITLQTQPNTPPGAYYGVIRFKAVPAGTSTPTNGGEVALTASVGTIVLITVPGTLNEQVQLTNIHVYSGGSEGFFFTKKPNKVGVELRNLGNGFSQPFGTVELSRMFGKDIYGYQLNNTNPRSNILPQSSRIFVDSIKNISSPGQYTVTANVVYGSDGTILTFKKTFWYVPLWLVCVMSAVILGVVIATTLSYRRYRRANKHAYKHGK